MQPNYDDWEDIIKLAQDLGAAEICLLQFLPLGLGRNCASDYAISTQQFLERGKELQARYTTHDFTIRLRDTDQASGFVAIYANGLVLANADLDVLRSGNSRQLALGQLTDEHLDTLWQRHLHAHSRSFLSLPHLRPHGNNSDQSVMHDQEKAVRSSRGE
jgi:hypothetical protein